VSPAAAEARPTQFVEGALLGIQVAPELVDTYMRPFHTVATRQEPSADEAIELQFLAGAVV
jgi:hypothetical protein